MQLIGMGEGERCVCQQREIKHTYFLLVNLKLTLENLKLALYNKHGSSRVSDFRQKYL